MSADTSKWIAWKGGACPVDHEAKVRVILRGGKRETGFAREFGWGHAGIRCAGSRLDITFYRVVNQ